MKIITRAEYQWDGKQYQLVDEDSYNYDGPISEAKGIIGHKGDLISPGIGSGKGVFETGGPVNQALDPLDIFGGKEKGQANDAADALPGQLSALNQQQANLARYDTSGPFGDSSWSIDPTTGRYTQTTNLNPSEQRQFDSRNGIAEQMMNKAGEWAPQGTFDYNSAVPEIANQQYKNQQSLAAPVMQANDSAWNAKMANAGISPNSDAYKEAQAQRTADTGTAQSQAKYAATTASIPLAQQRRQQQFSELAQLMGNQQLNSPALGGNGIDINGATNAANNVGINNANQSAAQRNANMQSMAGLMQLSYPNGFGG